MLKKKTKGEIIFLQITNNINELRLNIFKDSTPRDVYAKLHIIICETLRTKKTIFKS